jgi:hypothetical protein
MSIAALAIWIWIGLFVVVMGGLALTTPGSKSP